MTTFHDFALKIETSWAKKDVKPSLETWNVNDVIVYVWYIYSQIKKLKIWNIKKNNSKWCINHPPQKHHLLFFAKPWYILVFCDPPS